MAYPTDSGLLAKAVRRIAATGARIQAAGGATRTRVRDRSRAAGARAHAIAAKLRTRSAAGRDEAQATVMRVTGELADLAATTVVDAETLLANAKRALRRARAKAAALRARGDRDPVAGRRRGRLARAVADLAELLEATRRIVAQSRQRIAGITPDGATRRVSLHDADARPIAKGRLGRPVEFGYKAQVVDNVDGIVLDHTVEQGNPPDAPQLAPAIERVTHRTGRTPRAVTADRGYGEAAVDASCRPRGRHGRDPAQGPTGAGAASRGAPAGVPADRQVAHRQRGPDQRPQARLRLGPHPHRRHRGCPDLDRARRVRPQPDQDQQAGLIGDGAPRTVRRADFFRSKYLLVRSPDSLEAEAASTPRLPLTARRTVDSDRIAL